MRERKLRITARQFIREFVPSLGHFPCRELEERGDWSSRDISGQTDFCDYDSFPILAGRQMVGRLPLGSVAVEIGKYWYRETLVYVFGDVPSAPGVPGRRRRHHHRRPNPNHLNHCFR